MNIHLSPDSFTHSQFRYSAFSQFTLLGLLALIAIVFILAFLSALKIQQDKQRIGFGLHN